MKKYNTYHSVKRELNKYRDYSSTNLSSDKIEILKYNFKSEQREKWVAAARKIGELAASGVDDLRLFIEEKLTYSVNIHQQRHAFTALGSFYGHCSDPEEVEFQILNQYRGSNDDGSYLQKKVKIKLSDFIDEIFKKYGIYLRLSEIIDGELSPDEGDISLLKNILNNMVDSLESKKNYLLKKFGLSDSQNLNSYNELILSLGQSYYPDQKLTPTQIIKKLYIDEKVDIPEGFLADFERLLYQENYIENLSRVNFVTDQWEKYGFESFDILKKIEEEYVETLPIDGWHINSLVFVLDLILKKREDVRPIVEGLIRRSYNNNNIYLVNLPYFFLKQTEKEAEETKHYLDSFNLMLDKIENGKINFCHNNHHFSGFYLDVVNFLSLIYPEKNKYFKLTFYIDLPEKLASKYNRLCHDDTADEYAVRQLIEYVKSFFKEEFAWKALPEKTKNIFLVFDLLIKNLNNGLNIKDKILLVLEEKDEWLNKNDRLIDGFVRELKYLYFKRLDQKENYIQEAEFQVYSMIDLVQNWNWSSLADKDIASIIINAFDILWFKGEKVEQENFFKLFYTIFSQIPDGKIIEEMLEYCKNESLKNILKLYLKAYRITDHDSPEFINYFKSLRDKIVSEEKIPEDIKELYDYIFSEKLSLNRKTGNESINVFDIDRIIRLYGFKEESRLHDINVSEMYEFEPLQKYILKPIFKYKFIMEGDFLFDLYGGYGSSRSEGKLIKELQTQVRLKSDRFIGQLKEVMDYLEFYKDDYLSAFKNERDLSIIDDLGREILENLDEYQKLVGEFSFLERDFIRTTIAQAKSIIFEDSRYVSEISVALQNGNEERLINILNEEIHTWKINKRLRERYENIIYKYFLERGMFQEYNRQMIRGSTRFSPTSVLARLNSIIMDYRIIFTFILAPFFFYLLGETLGLMEMKTGIVIFYLMLSTAVSLILFSISIIMIIIGTIRWLKNKSDGLFNYEKEIREINSPENRFRYRMKFFLPKLFGVIFVVYLNFTLSDEMWTITHGVNIYLKAAVIVIFLVFIYYFIKSTQFDSVRLSDRVKKKRTRSIMSIGLFYSFFASFLFNLMYGASMFKRNRLEITEVDAADIFTMEQLNQLIPFQIPEWLQGIKLALLNDLHLLPELLVFWMVQMFFIAIILEFFLQRERIVKRD